MLIKCLLISLSATHTHTSGQEYSRTEDGFFFLEPNKPLNDHKDLILPNTTEDHLR